MQFESGGNSARPSSPIVTFDEPSNSLPPSVLIRRCDELAAKHDLAPAAPYLINCVPSVSTIAQHEAQRPIAIFEFNNREVAIFVWIAVLAAWSIGKPGIGRSAMNVVKSVVGTVLIRALLAALLYMVATIFALRFFGYWEPNMAKTATWWFLGTGAKATMLPPPEKSHFRSALLENLHFAAIIEFLGDAFTLPLAVELVLIPVVVLLGALQVVGRYQRDEQTKLTLRFLGGCSSALGVAILCFLFVEVVIHFHTVFSWDSLRQFALPLILMIAYVPFLFVWWYIVAMQSALHMLKFDLAADPALFGFARIRILRSVGLSLRRAQLFESKYRRLLWGAISEADVESVLNRFREEAKSR